MNLELPNDYWNFVMEFLPDYSSRDDVLKSDIYTRYLDGEEVCDSDIEYFFAGRSREDIEKEFIADEWSLFLEAYDNFASRRYGSEELTRNADNNENLMHISSEIQINEVLYVTNQKTYKLNDFIKEQIGSSNFIFEVVGSMDDEKMNHFNNLFMRVKNKNVTTYDAATADRMNYLQKSGCDLRFVDTATPLARTNLIKCGGMEMPAIVAGMLKEFYYNNLSSHTTMEDCIEYLADNDIAGYGFEDLEQTYRSRIAHMLLCTFTGMRLSSKWNGRQEVNGGYIVVKNDGNVAAFHSTIVDEFKAFLVAKMRMESPSHSRPKDMEIYKEKGKYYLKLGLQLGFALSRKGLMR